MTTAPTTNEAKDLAASYGAAGVAILAITPDGRVAYAQHGLTAYLGPPAGWLYEEAVRTGERLLRAVQEGRVTVEELDGLANGTAYTVED